MPNSCTNNAYKKIFTIFFSKRFSSTTISVSFSGKRPLIISTLLSLDVKEETLELSIADKWILTRLNKTIKEVTKSMEKYDFNLLLPEFRGDNLKTNPICTQACCANYAKQDIKDAIDYLIEKEEIDKDNIFIVGASGGGHMAMMMAGRAAMSCGIAASKPSTRPRIS